MGKKRKSSYHKDINDKTTGQRSLNLLSWYDMLWLAVDHLKKVYRLAFKA